MTTGGREQSSRDDCKKEYKRQTISPPDPEITPRSMTSRSTVTQPAGCVTAVLTRLKHLQHLLSIEM